MAGYVPGQQPANRSQEKEFVQAYEDVLERYKGEAAAGPALAGAGGPRLGRLQVGRRAGGASTRAGPVRAGLGAAAAARGWLLES